VATAHATRGILKVDHRGAIDLMTFKKGSQPIVGEGVGAWSGNVRPESIMWRTGLGDSILGFDLDTLTLEDFEAMRYHPQINASLSVLTFMIHQATWHIKCEDKRIADMIESNVRLIWTRLVRALSAAFWAGYSPAILEFENDPQGKFVIINKIKDLHPREGEVKWKEHRRSIGGQTRNYYTYDGIHQHGWGDIPAINTLWYPLLMEHGDMTGRKLLKPAFMPWYFSLIMHIYTNRYFERFGEPLPIGRAPFEDTVREPDGTEWTGKQLMTEMVTNLRNRGAVVLPSDRDSSTGTGAQAYTWDIDYLESQMRGVDFERYMTRLDEEMSLSLFTPLLLLRNADVGSHNLGVQHTQTYLWELNALLGDMKEYIDRYIVERLKAINFSPKAPRAEWIPKDMGKENVETIRGIIVELIRQNMAKPDITQLGEALGMDITAIRTVTQDPTQRITDPNAPENDTRQRTNRQRSGSGPQGVGGTPPAGSRTATLAARVHQDLLSTWQNGTIEISPMSADEIMTWGIDAARVQHAIEIFNGMDTHDFGKPEALVAHLSHFLTGVDVA
jgi:hypothetical protein